MRAFETIIGPFISPFTIPRPLSAPSTTYQHTLIIHCDNLAYAQYDEIFPDFSLTLQSANSDDPSIQNFLQLKRASELKRSALLLERLKDIADQDGKQYPPIDAIYLVDANGSEGPLWSALEGLQPRHLTICCSVTGYVNCSRIGRLDPPWHLESLTIVNGATMPFPAALQSIRNLTLFRCQNILYQPVPASNGSALEHLSLRECSGGAIFIAMCAVDPSLPGRLKTLELESPQLDFFELMELRPYNFKQTLRKCTALVSLRLLLAETRFTFGSKCTELPAFLPANLRHLEIYGPPGMASDLWIWEAYMEDPMWLASLESVCMQLKNTERRRFVDGGHIELAQDVLASKEVDAFMKSLRRWRDDIRIQPGKW